MSVQTRVMLLEESDRGWGLSEQDLKEVLLKDCFFAFIFYWLMLVNVGVEEGSTLFLRAHSQQTEWRDLAPERGCQKSGPPWGTCSSHEAHAPQIKVLWPLLYSQRGEKKQFSDMLGVQ